MKKYRLIKEYPGSPKLGTELLLKGINSYHTLDNKKVFNGLQPENYPEFWEVIEKDYEILTLTPNKLNIAYKPLQEIRTYKGDGVSPHWQIHSIRRKSDGEVFSIGDRVVFLGELERFNFTSKIEEFKIENNSLTVKNEGCLVSSLKNIKKLKEPLFTTEDGKEIYDEEELVYLVNPKTCAVTRITFNVWDKTRLLFKTKEGVDEWMLWNKLVLTLNDLLKSDLVSIGNLQMFHEIVKERI